MRNNSQEQNAPNQEQYFRYLIREMRSLADEMEETLDRIVGAADVPSRPTTSRGRSRSGSDSGTSPRDNVSANSDLHGKYVRITTRPYYNLKGTVSRKRGSKFWWIRLDDGTGRKIYKKTEHIQVL